jgi:hypothetical protein
MRRFIIGLLIYVLIAEPAFAGNLWTGASSGGVSVSTPNTWTAVQSFDAGLDVAGVLTTASLGSEMITSATNRNFTGSLGDWTAGAGWAYGTNNAIHTAGSAGTLSLGNAYVDPDPSSGNIYQITFTINTTTAGTVTVSVGSADVFTVIGHQVNTETQIMGVRATGSGALTFTPNSAWAGTIDDVSLKLVTPSDAAIAINNSDDTTGVALRSGGTGLSETLIGVDAGVSITSGNYNTFIGRTAGTFTTTGGANTGIGQGALWSNTTGGDNTAVGVNALLSNTIGGSNVAVGSEALFTNTVGVFNVAMGHYALRNNFIGGSNTAIGAAAGALIADDATWNQASSTSVYLGGSTKALADGDTNEIVIGYNAIGLGSNTAILGNSSIATTGLRGNVVPTTSTGTQDLGSATLGWKRFYLAGAAPEINFTDTTASAKSLTVAVDANLAQLRESAGASGSLMVLDLANNWVGFGGTPLYPIHVQTNSPTITVAADRYEASASPNPSMGLRASRGTASSPSAVQSGDSLGQFNMRGYGATAFATTSKAAVVAYAAENWTDSAQGAYLTYETTATGGTTRAERLRVANNGFVSIGTVADGATLLDLLGADNATVETVKINATQANVTAADTFIDFRSTSGSEGSIAGTGVAGVIAYNTFTGSHYTQVEAADRVELRVGMLLEATGEPMTQIPGKTRLRLEPAKLHRDKDTDQEVIIPERYISETFEAAPKPYLVKSRISRTKGSKAAYGVYGGTDKEGRDLVLALGTGLCYVTKTSRKIEVGDYLISSAVPGMMEAQADDIYRNSTVAKAMASPVWGAGQVSQQISCIYLGG